jgi:acyl-CoA thioesterase-1
MRTTLSAASLFLAALCLAACDPGTASDGAVASVRKVSPPPAPAAPAEASSGEPFVIFLGDSLTAGLGLEAEQAYPVLVEKRLEEEGVPLRTLNAGVSGDTTAGGAARLDWLLSQKPDVLVVGLGGNDGLRGLPLEQTEANLRQIVRRAQAAGVRVLLLGMQIPPNYGPEYTRGFAEIYTRIAKEMNVPLVPFLLEGVGGVEKLNQADGIHPTAEGQEKVAEVVAPYLEEVLK